MKNDHEEDFAKLIVVLVVLVTVIWLICKIYECVAAVVVAVVAAATSLLENQNENKKSPDFSEEELRKRKLILERFRVNAQPRLVYESIFGSSVNQIVLTVDATPKKGGGFLRLIYSNSIQNIKGSKGTIYYYSLDWSERVKFPQESDKFELMNALLALLVYLDRYYIFDVSDFLLKTDNTFVNKRWREGQGKGKISYDMRREFWTQLDLIKGNPIQVSRDDEDLQLANQLSKNRPLVEVVEIFKQKYYGYRMVDVSLVVNDFYHDSFFEHFVPRPYRSY